AVEAHGQVGPAGAYRRGGGDGKTGGRVHGDREGDRVGVVDRTDVPILNRRVDDTDVVTPLAQYRGRAEDVQRPVAQLVGRHEEQSRHVITTSSFACAARSAASTSSGVSPRAK